MPVSAEGHENRPDEQQLLDQDFTADFVDEGLLDDLFAEGEFLALL